MIQTNLLGREVITPWNEESRGTIVAVFVDRGEMYVAIEAPVGSREDGRTQISIEGAVGLVLKGKRRP